MAYDGHTRSGSAGIPIKRNLNMERVDVENFQNVVLSNIF